MFTDIHIGHFYVLYEIDIDRCKCFHFLLRVHKQALGSEMTGAFWTFNNCKNCDYFQPVSLNYYQLLIKAMLVNQVHIKHQVKYQGSAESVQHTNTKYGQILFNIK